MSVFSIIGSEVPTRARPLANVRRKSCRRQGGNVAVGSSIQVALLIGPLLVFLGVAFGQRMDLAFSQMEVASIALSVAVATSVMRDAESNWLEGVFLLLAYAILGVAFFFF